MYDNKGNLKDLHLRIFATDVINQPDKFIVFPYEAGSRKTTTMVNALKDLYRLNPKHKTLIATKLMEEQEILKEGLGNIAMVVNTDNKVKEDILHQVPILIITHELYKRLCKDYTRRQYYIKNRGTLIIDEQLDLLDVNEFTTQEAERIKAELETIIIYDENKDKLDLADFWGSMVNKLNVTIADSYGMKMNFVHIENDKIDKQIEVLTERIKSSGISKTKKKNLIRDIGYCKYFFNNTEVIANSARLLTYNKSTDYFMLNNNILLDASGKFLELYNISDKFIVKDFDRVIDHKNTELVFIEENSTTSYISSNTKEYFDNLIRFIKSNTESGDKVLLVGRERINKMETMDLLEPLFRLEDIEFDFVNFMAMRGKNDWRDYNKCFVIHFPNDLFHNYIFQYLQYRKSTKEPLANIDLEINKVDTHHGFCNNKDLENLRITDVVSNIYQALKRVNRVNTATNSSTFYVVTNNKRVQDMLIEQFRGLKSIQRTRMSEKKSQTSLEASLVHEYFISMNVSDKVGTMSLREICNIGSRTQFARVLEELGNEEYLQAVAIERKGNSYVKVA